MYGSVNDMVSGRISSCQLRSHRKRLCANSWNLDGIEQRAIQVVHNVVPHQVFSCVQSGMVGMSTVTYPMADSTGYHSKRFSGITGSFLLSF